MSTRAGARPEVGAARRWRWESVGNYLSAPPCLLIQRINSVCNHRHKPKPGRLRSAFTCWPNFTFEGCLLSVILEVNFQPHTMMGRIQHHLYFFQEVGRREMRRRDVFMKRKAFDRFLSSLVTGLTATWVYWF